MTRNKCFSRVQICHLYVLYPFVTYLLTVPHISETTAPFHSFHSVSSQTWKSLGNYIGTCPRSFSLSFLLAHALWSSSTPSQTSTRLSHQFLLSSDAYLARKLHFLFLLNHVKYYFLCHKIFLSYFIYSWLRVIGLPDKWYSRLSEANIKEQKKIENVTRVWFAYLGDHAV
jgi:hypothetical protein